MSDKGKHIPPVVASHTPTMRKIATSAHYEITQAIQDLKARDGPQLDDAIAHLRTALDLLHFFIR